MPKITPDQRREMEAIKLLKHLLFTSGVTINTRLEAPLVDMPIGTYLFGTLKLDSNYKLDLTFNGTSNPLRK